MPTVNPRYVVDLAGSAGPSWTVVDQDDRRGSEVDGGKMSELVSFGRSSDYI